MRDRLGIRSSPMRIGLSFLMHQLLSTVGVMLGSGLLVAFAFDVIRWFGRPLPAPDMYRVLSGSPFFPAQIIFGLLLGWLVGHRRRQQRILLWVWIIPLVFLGYAITIGPSVTSLPVDARLSRFFGWGCQWANQCFDQLGITLPFYTSVSYALGGLLARRLRMTTPAISQRLPSGQAR